MKASIEMQGLEPTKLAQQVADYFSQWQTGRQKWLDRVREVVGYVYATSTRETSNSKNPWSHSTVIPKLTQIHDNLGANYSQALFGRREFFTFEPARLEDASLAKRTAIVNYLATKHDLYGFREVMKECLNDWVQTGNAFARVEYVREVEVDPETEQEVVTYEGPRVFRISPYDVVFDHTTVRFQDSPKIIRQLLTRGELLRLSESPEGAGWDKAELARLRRFYGVVQGMRDADINKSIQMRMDGFTSPASYFRSGKTELLHFIGDIYDAQTDTLMKQVLITVVDRRCILEIKPLADYQGYGKIFHSPWRRRTDNLYGQGPLDNIVGLQYRMNHLENAKADGFDQMLSPDRVFIGTVEVQKDGPVTNYFVDDVGGDVKNLTPDPTVLNADTQIQLIEAQMEAYAGAPREALGIRSPGEKTKFEVQQLGNAAGRLFQTKIEDFEIGFVEPIINCELEVSVRNFNGADVAVVLDNDFGVKEFREITKDDLIAKGTLKARGSSHYAKRAQLVQELQEFGRVLQADPAMAVHFPAKARAKAWNDALSFDRLDLYQPYGMIEEQLELQKQQQIAQGLADETQATIEGDAVDPSGQGQGF